MRIRCVPELPALHKQLAKFNVPPIESWLISAHPCPTLECVPRGGAREKMLHSPEHRAYNSAWPWHDFALLHYVYKRARKNLALSKQTLSCTCERDWQLWNVKIYVKIHYSHQICVHGYWILQNFGDVLVYSSWIYFNQEELFSIGENRKGSFYIKMKGSFHHRQRFWPTKKCKNLIPAEEHVMFNSHWREEFDDFIVIDLCNHTMLVSAIILWSVL